VAEDKHLAFEILIAKGTPEAIETDELRLRQLLRNLLSNAVKFTERGHVQLTISAPATPEWSVDNEVLNNAGKVLAFSVVDTGIGVPKDKQ
jgi:signal transduction histidine kinase